MSHIQHILKNKEYLEMRSHIIKTIREFFWTQNFLEVETPLLVRLPGQEPYLSPMGLNIHNEKNKEFKVYLHTSPEYTMKKMLAAGFQNIFSICKCFRDQESFGGQHNPEFTMIEWYRTWVDFYKIMDDVENLITYIRSTNHANLRNIEKFRKVSMKDLWYEQVGVNLDDYLEKEKILSLCQRKGYKAEEKESYEDLFYRIFLNEIEPNLLEPTIIHHYPAQMAALAKLSDEDSRYAERFEVYINRTELANAFTELTDAKEQLCRLQEEQKQRQDLDKEVYDIDQDFIEAVKNMPPSAGIALGVDRLIMALLGCQNINSVIVLPADKLF